MIVSLSILLMAMAPQPADTPAEIAECVVDNDMMNVRALLETIPGSPAERKVTAKVLSMYGGCNDNSRADGGFAWRERAELAAAALSKTIEGKTPDAAGVAAQTGWALKLPAGFRAGIDYDSGSAGMRMLGDCIVKANAQSALDLFRADAGSAAETAAFGGLSRVIAPCIPAGQSMKVKRQDLRLIVAEPLFHALSR